MSNEILIEVIIGIVITICVLVLSVFLSCKGKDLVIEVSACLHPFSIKVKIKRKTTKKKGGGHGKDDSHT